MKKKLLPPSFHFLFFILILLFVISQAPKAHANMNVNYLNFLDQISSNQNPDETQISPEFKKQIKQIHFVLVAGILNEFGRKLYFEEIKKNLEHFGATVTIVFPSSGLTPTEESPLLRDQFEKAYSDGGNKPMVVLGHSQGGQKSIVTALDYPELVTSGRLLKIIALQSALSGNALFSNIPLANIASEYSPLDQIQALNNDNLIQEIAHRQRNLWMINKFIYQALSKATHFILTHEKLSRMNPLVRPFGLIIKGFKKTQNDGLVATQHMMLYNFGSALGYINHADHLSLVANAEKKHEAKAKAFTLSALIEILKNLNGDINEQQKLTSQLQLKFKPSSAVRTNMCANLFK